MNNKFGTSFPGLTGLGANKVISAIRVKRRSRHVAICSRILRTKCVTTKSTNPRSQLCFAISAKEAISEGTQPSE